MQLSHLKVETPIGKLTILCDDTCIIRLLFENDNWEKALTELKRSYGAIIELQGPNALARSCAEELKRYFSGKLTAFTVQPSLEGSVFEKAVWKGLCGIPYGEAVSYAQLAGRCGVRGARAVGGAVGRNPVPIIVPCHRVINSNGLIGGYRGGLGNKRKLIALEGIALKNME